MNSTRASVIAMALVSVTIGCEGKAGDVAGRKGAVGTTSAGPAPSLVGKTLDGEPFSLEGLAGQVALVNVWATWCAPCREELPELQRLHGKHADRGFTVVGVSVDRRAALRAVRAMVDDFGLTYPIVFDPEAEAIAGWSVRGYPTSFLIDRAGQIRWRRDGIVSPDDAELGAAIEAALATQP